MSHTLSRVPKQPRSITVNQLCIPGLWVTGDVLGEWDVHHVGPLLHGLGEIGVAEGRV